MQMSDQEIIKEIKTNACIVGMIIAGIFAIDDWIFWHWL